MSTTDTPAFGTDEATEDLAQLLDAQLRFLRATRLQVTRQTGVVHGVAFPLVWAIGESCETLILLAQDRRLRDSYSIARCIIEGVVNVLYVYAEGTPVAERALRYWAQKSFRGINRQLQLLRDHLGCSSDLKLEVRKGSLLEDAIDEFTAKKGREMNSWSGYTLERRLQTAEGVFGSQLIRMIKLAIDAVFVDASEVVHSTYYGALLAMGRSGRAPIGQPASSELEEYQRKHVQMLLVVVAGCICTLMKAIGMCVDLHDGPDTAKELYLDWTKRYFEAPMWSDASFGADA